MDSNILTVSQLTNTIRVLLEENLGVFTVQGEISNFKIHSSGHRYFTLKDEGAQISCTLWRGKNPGFELSDGMKVVINGKISVYPPRGQYQIDVISIVPMGKGDLYIAFEALKKKLQNVGYFDEKRKKILPKFPLKIGIATSSTGAAIQDMISTIKRRFPAVQIYFRPTLVQGEEADLDIVSAINDLTASPAEVIIIGRGGGSIEDLWAFNMEIVAGAIYNCSKPIISAVGHETDFTIADFVADVRAATPTAAAELVTNITQDDIHQFLDSTINNLTNNIISYITDARNQIDDLTDVRILRRTIDKINLHFQQIDDYEQRISRTTTNTINSYKEKILFTQSYCKSLFPLAPMKKGFALLRKHGRILSNNDSLSTIRNFEIIRANETAEAKVIRILPKSLFN